MKCRFDSYDCRNNRVRHVASPHPIGRSAHAMPRPDPLGNTPGGKGAQNPPQVRRDTG
jgi:hypothetical protein